MAGLDEISKLIGSLESSVKTLTKTQESIWQEIKDLRGDMIIEKISAARSGGRMGVITAIGTFGVIKGIEYIIKGQ